MNQLPISETVSGCEPEPRVARTAIHENKAAISRNVVVTISRDARTELLAAEDAGDQKAEKRQATMAVIMMLSPSSH